MKIKITSKDGTRFTKLSDHVLEHKIPLHLIQEALESAEITDPGTPDNAVVITRDFGYNIGMNRCVKVYDGDDVYLYPRGKRKGYSSAVRGRNPEPTPLLTLVLSPLTGTIITAYFGPPAPREPWDPTLTPREKAESIEFWSHHALIL